VPSTELLAVARREGGGADEGVTPMLAQGVTDSPRGFVPFRSLKSYENLLKLQAAAEAGAA
jgi:hypothetical protein